MTDQAIGLTHSASVPRGSIVGIARTKRGIVPIQYGIIAGNLVAEFFGLFIVVEVALTIVFTKSPSRVAGSTILDDVERGYVNLGGMLICFLGQLARVGRGYSMLSKHSRRKVPWIFWIEGILDDDFPFSIRPALLKMVAIGDTGVIVTGAASLLGAIGCFTLQGQWVPVESPEDDLVMQRDLGWNRSWVNEDEEKENENS